MLRIKDPKRSVPFYENHLGFKLIHKYDFPQWNFSLYFMAILPEGEEPPPLGPESEAYCWNFNVLYSTSVLFDSTQSVLLILPTFLESAGCNS